MTRAWSALGLLGALGGCTGGALEIPDDDGHAPDQGNDGTYDARLLTTNLGRIVISKRDTARGVCTWILIAQSRNALDTITTPAGWVEESASINTEAATCFTLQPLAPGFWPAEGQGAITFGAKTGTDAIPCTLSVHVTLAADLTAQGLQRPAGISSQERFDAEGLAVDGLCPR
jgi:hypothetical protein